ncbi:MAG: hypothetical protein AAFV85_12930 [Cyanobacteria bacterium J06634_6]
MKKMIRSNACPACPSANPSSLRHAAAIGTLIPTLASVLLLSSFVKSAIAQPSEQLVSTMDAMRSENIVRSAQYECLVSDDSSESDELVLSELRKEDYVQTLLSDAIAAAEQIEDARQRGLGFVQIGESYACLQQYEQADAALKNAIAATDEIEDIPSRTLLLRDIASLYGRSVGDVAQMNAALTQMVGLIAPYSNTKTVSSYIQEFKEAARLYAETGQYQQLRDLVDLFDDDADKLALVRTAAPALSQIESEADSELIASLFSDFDLETIFRNFAEAPSAVLPIGPNDPATQYAAALRDTAPEATDSYSPSSINTFIDEQIAVIDELPNTRLQIDALDSLGRFLLQRKQYKGALAAFATAAQRLEEPVASQTGRPSYDFRVSRRYVSTAEAHFQLGEFELGVLAIDRINRDSAAVFDYVNTLLKFSRERSVPLSDQQRIELLRKAEAMLPMIEDGIKQITYQSYIANNYAAVGEVEKAREILSVVAAALPSGEALAEETSLAIAYSRLLAVTGDFEQAIAFAESMQNPSLYFFLPAQLVAANQYELAEEKLNVFISPRNYFRAAERMIREYASTDDAYAFTARTLQKLQNEDFASEEERQQLADVQGDYALIDLERQRTTSAYDLIEQAIWAPEPGAASRHVLTAEEKADIMQLIAPLGNDWLQTELIQRFFPAEESLSLIDADDQITVPESLLLRNIVELTEDSEFEQAIIVLERVRSPYIRTQALIHIADGYVVAERNAQQSQ